MDQALYYINCIFCISVYTVLLHKTRVRGIIVDAYFATNCLKYRYICRKLSTFSSKTKSTNEAKIDGNWRVPYEADITLIKDILTLTSDF
jgi:hypothetical protein